MKRTALFLIYLYLLSISVFALPSSCENPLHSNPLYPLNPDLPIPFDKIKVDDFKPAFERSYVEVLKNFRSLLQAVQAHTTSPFETVRTLEGLSTQLDLLMGVFSVYHGNYNTPQVDQLSEEFSTELEKLSSLIYSNHDFFKEVRSAYQISRTQTEVLSPEDKKLIENTYKHFVKGGAELNADQKERLTAVNTELSLLGIRFSKNLLDFQKEEFLLVSEESALKGLSEVFIKEAQELSKKNRVTGFSVRLSPLFFLEVLEKCEVASTREKMWRLYTRRNHEGKYSNQESVLKIIALREEKAKLLGYPHFAAMTLSDRMMENIVTAQNFLNNIAKAAYPMAQQELKSLEDFREKLEGTRQLAPWDISYYSEKQRALLYGFSEDELREYFDLEQVLNKGVLHTLSRLANVEFVFNKDVPTYDPDVQIIDVYQQDSAHTFLGRVYFDPYERRERKRGGAWMNDFFPQYIENGKNHRPVISVTTNFERKVIQDGSTSRVTSFLKPDEVRTLFHEWGHAFHGLASQVKYASLSGTNIQRDMVELPSQLLENWAFLPETLSQYAFHKDTHQRIPDELVKKFLAGQRYQNGLFHISQLRYGILDLVYHSQSVANISSVKDFENQSLAFLNLFKEDVDRVISTSFRHIFSGGYASGYLMYLWGNFLEADIFDRFLKEGVWNSSLFLDYTQKILSNGGVDTGMNLYTDFMGRPPAMEPYLKRENLVTPNSDSK